MNKLILLALSASGAIAAVNNALLTHRALYQVPCSDQGEKDCGSGCIDLSWTCCPDGSGGCPPSASCYLGTNGEYGCCPEGESCVGEGGASTDAYTNTIIVPETSTAYGEATTTEGGDYEQPTTDTETSPPATYSVVDTYTQPSSYPVETTSSSPELPTYSEPETLQTATQTYVQPDTTPVVPTTPGYGSNSTKPAQTTAPATSVIINGAGSCGINMVGGLLAGVAALLI